MQSLSEKEKESVERMVECLEKIKDFSKLLSNWQELEADEMRLDAILMNFVNLGECVLRLSEPFFLANPEIEWRKIKGLRNIVAHDYWGVDVEMVWQIVNDYVPKLRKKLVALKK